MKEILFLITGTPRSGISVLGHSFASIGCQDLNARNDINSVTIHKLMLQDFGFTSDMIGSLPHDWLKSDCVASAKRRILHLLDNCNGSINFIADPLICRFFSLWSDCLKKSDAKAYFIGLARHPWECALSMQYNYNIGIDKSHLLWFVYFQDLLNMGRDSGGTLITFEQLMADPITIITNILKKNNLFDPLKPQLFNSDFLSHFQPELKHFHASDLSDKDRNRFQVYVNLYDSLRKLRHDVPHSGGTASIDSKITSNVIASLLRYVGAREQKTFDHFTNSPYHYQLPMNATVIFPSKKHLDGISRSISLKLDEWQTINLPVPESNSLPSNCITLIPMNANGMATISTISLKNSVTGESIWQISDCSNNGVLNFGEHVINISDKMNMKLLLTGPLSKIKITIPDIEFSVPLNFEFWIKPSIIQDLSQYTLLPKPKDQINHNDFVINLKDLPISLSDEDSILEYILDETSNISDREKFDLLLQLCDHSQSKNIDLKALHYLNISKSYTGQDIHLLLRLAHYFTKLKRPKLALDCYIEGLIENALADDRLSKSLINNYRQIRKYEERQREHGHQLLMKFIDDNIDHIKKIATRPLTLVEIGSTREELPGQGSTEKLANFCKSHGFHFITVDMDPQNTKRAKRVIKKINSQFEAINNKGENYLKEFIGIIDFIFLDAYDFDHGKHSEDRQSVYEKFLGQRISDDECHLMHLECVKNIKDKIPKHGAICIDDTWYKKGKWQAKGSTAIPYLLQNNFSVIATGNNGVILVPNCP